MFIYHNISLNSSQNEKPSKALEKNKTGILCLIIFFAKISWHFMRQCGSIYYTQTGHGRIHGAGQIRFKRRITKGTYKLTYLLTPWCRVLLEKLTGLQPVKKSPHFTEPEGSLPHSQTSATCLYPGPAQSSPYTHIPPPGDTS